MTDFPIEELLPRAKHSIYKLVSMASARALELSEGKRCLADGSTTEKFTTMALEEILQGKVELRGADSVSPGAQEGSKESEEEEE